MQNSTQIAIRAALSHDWEKAISTNQTILIDNPNDIDALNRLAHAYTKTGKIQKAKQTYHKVISLDRYNVIARKNLDRIQHLTKTSKIRSENKNKMPCLSPNLFIEEPGRTKTVTLTNIAPGSVLSTIDIGDPVMLYPKKHSIEARSQNKTYLGALPDDITFRLLRFLKAGNIYHVCIKNVAKNSLSIFIREIKRGKRYLSQPSFLQLSPEHMHTTHDEFKSKELTGDLEEAKSDHEGLEE